MNAQPSPAPTDGLPELLIADPTAVGRLTGHLAEALERLGDDGLADSPEADDLGDALDHLAAWTGPRQTRITLPSSNAIRAIRQGILESGVVGLRVNDPDDRA